MDALFQQHAKVIAVTDGNFYNKALKTSVEYFEEIHSKGADIDDYIAQFKEIYIHNNDHGISSLAAKILLRNAIRKQSDEGLLELTTRGNYSSYSMMKGLSALVAEGMDIYILFPLLMQLFKKENYAVPDAILAYFSHKKYADKRKLKIPEAVDFFCPFVPKHPKLSEVIHRLLYANYPDKDIELQIKWLAYPALELTVVGNLLGYIPKFYSELSPVAVVLKQKLAETDSWIFSYTQFLTHFAFYKVDFSLLDFLWQHPEKDVANISIKILAELSVADKTTEKVQQQTFFQYTLKFFVAKEAVDYKEFQTAFSLFFRAGMLCSDEQLGQLLALAKNYRKKAALLFLLEKYADIGDTTRQQLQKALKTAITDDVHLLEAKSFFTSGKPLPCGFCSNVAMKINTSYSGDLPKENDTYLKQSGIAYSGGNLLQCNSCTQYYFYFYEVEYDVNSMQEYFTLEKVSPAHILPLLTETQRPKVQENYDALLNKALAEQFSPIAQLRQAACSFLAAHYLNLKDRAAFLQLMKTALPQELSICLECYKTNENGLAATFLGEDVFQAYLKNPYQENFTELATVLGLQFIQKPIPTVGIGLLGLLKHENTAIREGALQALLATPETSFVPNIEILQFIQALAQDKEYKSYKTEALLKKYKPWFSQNDVAHWLQILAEGKDEKIIVKALSIIQENWIEKFDMALFPKLVAYMKNPKLEYRALSFFKALLKKVRLDLPAIKEVLIYMKSPEAADDSFYFFDEYLKKNHPVADFLADLLPLIIHPKSEIAGRCICLLHDYAAKGECIGMAVPTLIENFGKKEAYLNEYMVYAVVYHYFYHEQALLLPFLEGLSDKTASGQAMAALSNLAEKKEDLSNFYGLALRSMNELHQYLKDSAVRMLYYACKHRQANAQLRKLADKIYGDGAVTVMEKIEKW